MNKSTYAELREFVGYTLTPQVRKMRNCQTQTRTSITPHSETTASVAVTFPSTDSGPVQRVICFCYRLESQSKPWRYFIPTYDHIAGFFQCAVKLQAVELANATSTQRYLNAQ